MKLKHRVNITVSDNDGNSQPILQACTLVVCIFAGLPGCFSETISRCI